MFEKLFSVNLESSNVIGLTDQLKALYLIKLFNESDSSILFVCNSLYEANKYNQILSNHSDNVLLFPMDDFLTSEALAISPELKSTRIQTLSSLISNEKKIVVTNLMGYLRFLPKKELFKKKFISLNVNEDYKINDLVNNLFDIGYRKETVVNKTGEIAVRGYVVDLFSNDSENPIRIEFWGDTIESIREFDLNNQLTIKNVPSIIITPNTELLINEPEDLFLKPHRILQAHDATNILTYLDDRYLVFDDYQTIENSYKLLTEEMYNYSISKDLPGATKYMYDLNELGNKKIIYFSSFDNVADARLPIVSFNSKQISQLNGSMEQILAVLKGYLKDKTVVVCLSNRYKVNKIIDEFSNDIFVFTNLNEIYDDKINLVVQNISYGFEYDKYIFISEREIFKKESNSQYKTNFKLGTKIKDITKLNIGDYVVHNIHGIGIYLGIKRILKNGLEKDYIMIEYKGNDKLYIPVEKIELITKYSSNEGAKPKINKLGSIEWQKTKLRVRSKVQDIASELLEIYAKREAAKGFAFDSDDELQMAFENEFPYKETVDQLKVTSQIKEAMQKQNPMDMLLCGDVGYGKTEVAFRAMFKAFVSGKQVALLCPTTILSNQHYKNALQRFKSFPVNIAILNRFVSSKKVKQIIEEIKSGKVDIVIGTHRLLSSDIVFKDLGLLVIDEEQRFGVKHKEKIKQYKNDIDILTLSATPIPRTLQMSMTGIRSLALIETPPVNRYPVQTYVLANNNQIIKDAIYKEISRGGQVFLLYNHIKGMESKIKELEHLVPDAKMIYTHGKMSKEQIEDVMIRFTEKEYDVLVCTTIIETGIDIPNVNTLIIMDADCFGLSQLYQIRGRVGRSDKIAYCYLMYDNKKILTEIAVKRLNVIKDFTELGSGFSIAMRDLAIRGAGDILGSEQAGFVESVGIELFLNMLDQEIRKLKGEEVLLDDEEDTQPLIEVATSISDNYVNDEELKIEIHKMINSIDSEEKLGEVKSILEDRFGKVDDNTVIYMYEEWFEKEAKSLGIKTIRQLRNFIEIVLPKEIKEKLDGQKLFLEITRLSKMFRFKVQNNNIILVLDTVKLDKHFIFYLIKAILIIKNCIKKSY